MHADQDPFMPTTSRFPLSPTGGRIVPSSEGPSSAGDRPFGMRFSVRAANDEGKHSKKPTQKSKSEQTAQYNDGQISGYKADVEYYTEMD